MENKWVLSVKTSLPDVCRSKDDIKTVFYVYDSFEEARAAMRAEISKYTGQKNTMFDRAGRIKKLTEFISYIGKVSSTITCCSYICSFKRITTKCR